MSDPLITQVEDLVRRHKELLERRSTLERQKASILTLKKERTNRLAGLMAKCREAGFEPNDLREQVQHLASVAKVKLDTWNAEIEASENMIKPMLSEIKG